MLDTDIAISLWLDKVDTAEAIVFDLDGTLIQTDAANLLAYEAAISHCLDQCPKAPLDVTKRVTREVLQEWLPTATHTEIQDVVEYKEKIYRRFLFTTKINQPMLRLLKLAQGKEVVLATNCRRARAEIVLSHHGLCEKFTRKYFFENNNNRNKYKEILSDLDMDSDRIVMFDNDPNSVVAAIAAGARPDSIFLVTNSW